MVNQMIQSNPLAQQA